MAINESEKPELKHELEKLMHGHSPRRMHADVEFLTQSRDELRAKYPNHWVAVYDRKVVAVESDLTQLTKTLEDQQMREAQVIIDFLPKDNFIIVV